MDGGRMKWENWMIAEIIKLKRFDDRQRMVENFLQVFEEEEQ